MTDQEAFSKAITGLLKQGVKSEVDGECRYRVWEEGSDDLLFCDGIGHILPDSEYRPWLEGLDIRMMLDATFRPPWPALLKAPSGRTYVPPTLEALDYDLLSAIEALHDDNEPHQWPVAAAAIAAEFGLTMPEPS